jgi:hypothetical protein
MPKPQLPITAVVTPSEGQACGIAFLVVEADIDVHYGWRDGAACAEFLLGRLR